jgi:hypothetical protein
MLVVALAMLRSVPLAADEAGAERTGWQTGRRLTQELARPVNIVLQRTTPRQVVLQLRKLHEIALWLDRRIDPDQPIDVQFTQVSLQEALETFALQLDAELAQVGGTLFIGLPGSTDRIRTLIELHTAELRQFEGEEAVGRQSALLRGTTMTWEDLAEPSRLVDDLCTSFEVKRSGEGRVPHDLWAAGAMADVNAVEALSLLLGQFELTFEWQDQSSAMSVVPMPRSVTVLREHTPKRQDLAQAVALIRQQFPHLKPTATGRLIRVDASIGEHEAIAALLDPSGAEQMSPTASQGPLSRRRFTIKATRAEAIAILRTLETQGVVVEYDAEQLRQAGIDLREVVTLKLNEATAEELFHQLCEPLGLMFEIDDTNVRLSPAAPE